MAGGGFGATRSAGATEGCAWLGFSLGLVTATADAGSADQGENQVAAGATTITAMAASNAP